MAKKTLREKIEEILSSENEAFGVPDYVIDQLLETFKYELKKEKNG